MKACLFCFVFFAFCFTVSAQERRHDIYAGAGVLPLPHIKEGWATSMRIGAIFGGRNSYTSYSIPIQAGYTYHLSEKVELGILLNRYGYQRRYTDNNEVIERTRFISLLPNVHYLLYKTDKVSIYSGLGVGLSQITHLPKNELQEKVSYRFVSHFKYFGMKVGQRSGLFFDCGIGYNGLINIGLFARL